MRILLITQEPPLRCEEVATGNAVRAQQLMAALEGAGHRVRQVWLAKRSGAGGDSFNGADSLRSRILAWAPDVLLVGYWELLSLLPSEPEQPVVLDFVAPRPLETLFERPERVHADLRRLRVNLTRCDLLLVGNLEQRMLLAWWLMEAGLDLRANDPVRVVPLAGTVREGQPPDPAAEGWTLVGGGVTWPWRNAEAYLEALGAVQRRHPDRLRIEWFGGPYRGHAEKTGPAAPGPHTRRLMNYGDYLDFLAESAHIGLELGDDNLERRCSQSFRSVDFLRHGLPLICNEWLPVARSVEAFEAGWTVRGPAELPSLVERIMADPEEWRRRRANALRLAEETLDPDRAAQPLLAWLEAPTRAARLPRQESGEPVLGVPPWRERIARRYRLARRVLLHRLFGHSRRAGERRAVVMVSRGDLFPADHGAAVKIVETARGLARNDRPVSLVTDDRRHYWQVSGDGFRQVRYPAWLRLLAWPLALVKLDHYSRDIPESNAFLYLPLTDRSFFWRTLYVAGRTGAGLLQAEFPAYALPCIGAAEVLDCPVVLVEHNVEYQRLESQVPELTPAQFERFRALEIELCNRADAVVCVSDNDRQRLAEDGVHPGLLHTIPHGIDLAAWDASAPGAIRDDFGIAPEEPLLVFHGTFAYPPNRAALQRFADDILPGLEARGIRAHLLAVGDRPPAGGLHPRIHCTGSVEQVAPCLKAADLAVVPLTEGGGTRMKILDYFAAKLPVVSTAKGIEGIPVVDGREAMIADEPAKMCEAIESLLRNPSLARDLADAGRAFAERLDWQEIGARYVKLYSALSR